MNNKFWLLIALSFLALACNLTNLVSPPSDSAEPDVEQPASADEPLLPVMTATSEAIPSNPIGLRQGLSSLNSYRLEIRTINNGPTAQDKNEVTFLMESASDGESWHISNTIIASTADEPEISTDQSEQYKVGNLLCEISGDGEEAEETDVDPQTQEIQDAWSGLTDLVPMVSDPVYIDSQSLNGVQTNHFRFKVSGLGVDSGAEVVASEGEYWLAVDGQYIVKYIVHLETRNGPAGDANTHTMRSELFIEVKDINQPIEIVAPAQCQ